MIDDQSERLSSLTNELANMLSEVGRSQEDEREAILVRVQDTIRKMSQEIGTPQFWRICRVHSIFPHMSPSTSEPL
jgi:hypothetical protein